MPEWDGRLTPAESTRLQRWFKDHWRNQPCAIDGVRNWVTADHVVQTPIYKGDSFEQITQGDLTYVYIAFICANCGHTLFVNATAIGIIEKGTNG